VYFRNRDECLVVDKNKPGVECNWQWTSDLHITKVFSSLGLLLMKKALRDWPIKLQTEPKQQEGEIEISFIIGHHGKDRLPHLLTTLQSIAAQQGVSFECLVIEQSNVPEIKESLPSWVRYVHSLIPQPDLPYNRSQAFNAGARVARGKILVLHDNDMLVPQHYGSQIVRICNLGHEIINLKRFIFYLSQEHSQRLFFSECSLTSVPPETVVQNLEAGGSVAVKRRAYFALGGFDESFVGWGGEDDEFWERAQTLQVWEHCYLPIVHLWHQPQPEKLQDRNANIELFKMKRSVPVTQRIKQLSISNFGNAEHTYSR
jgi:hypothetical protein